MVRVKIISVFLLAFALELSADEEILIIPPEVEALLSSSAEVEDPECPENEQFIYCRKGCATCSDRYCRIPGCEQGCGCKQNHYRIEPNGICVPVHQCPVNECGENEIFRHCGPVCEFCGPFRCKQIDCTYQCFCKPGYLRNKNRTCIPEIECPKPEVCFFHEVMTSPSRKDEYCSDEPSNETVDAEQCNCLPNHRRSKTGFCINEKDCPPDQCDITETYYDCVPQCDTTCSNYEEEDCTEEEEFCYSACFCSRGLVMNNEGFCVRYEECNLKPNRSSTFEILTRTFKIHFTQTLGVVDTNDASQTQESEEDEALRAQILKQNLEEGGEKKDETTRENINNEESTDDVADHAGEQGLDEEKGNEEVREVLESANAEEDEGGNMENRNGESAIDIMDNDDQIDNIRESGEAAEAEEDGAPEEEGNGQEEEGNGHAEEGNGQEEEDNAPGEEEVATEEEEVAPEEEEAAPEEEEVAPEEEEVSPEEEEVAPEEEEVAPEEEEVAPEEEEVAPEEDDVAPEEENDAPEEENDEPEEQDAAPEEDDVAPEGENVAHEEDDEEAELHRAEFVEGDGVKTIHIESEDKNIEDAISDDAMDNDDEVINNDDAVIHNDDEVIHNDDEVTNNDDEVINNDGEGTDNDDNAESEAILDKGVPEADDVSTECKENETLKECVVPCNDCKYRGNCDYLFCEEGCDCINGYHRDENEVCIPEAECPEAAGDHEEETVAVASASSSDEEENV